MYNIIIISLEHNYRIRTNDKYLQEAGMKQHKNTVEDLFNLNDISNIFSRIRCMILAFAANSCKEYSYIVGFPLRNHSS